MPFIVAKSFPPTFGVCELWFGKSTPYEKKKKKLFAAIHASSYSPLHILGYRYGHFLMYVFVSDWLNTDTEYVLCQHCNSKFQNKVNILLVHCRKCESISRPDKSHYYMCYTCPYHTFSYGNMKRHIYAHCGEKFLKCLNCSYESSNYSHLKRHSLRHMKEKEHECFCCDFKSASREYFKVHLRKKHNFSFWLTV